MDPRTFPTKGNLMLAKNSLTLAKQGYDLMDKKRNILIRELMDLIDEARDIQNEIDSTFTHAYECLQRANIEHGINMVAQLAYTVPIENSITIQTRSIMGTEIPHVRYTPANEMPTYSFSALEITCSTTNASHFSSVNTSQPSGSYRSPIFLRINCPANFFTSPRTI